MGVKEAKAAIRKRIWDLLEKRDIARFPRPVHGRIPNFDGADRAAEKVRQLKEWKAAKVVFANPDSAQIPARAAALCDGKKLIMASPRLKAGYLLIDPVKLKGFEGRAATIRGAFKFGKPVKRLPKADLVITGSVAVDKRGYRLGKGGGYGDIEIARLKKERSITKSTPIITTVHDVQLVQAVPFEAHDQKVSFIVTPKKIIKCKPES